MKTKRTYSPVDISKIVNRGFRDVPGNDMAGGWTNQGDYDLRGMRPGNLKIGSVEFNILDPSANQNRSVIALRNHDPAFVTEAAIAMGNEICDWIYLLNSCAFINSGATAGIIKIKYEGAGESLIPVKEGVHVANWWTTIDVESGLRVQMDETNALTYTTPLYGCWIKNPHPERRVDEVVFMADTDQENNAIWLILAVATGTGKNLLAGRKKSRIRADLGKSAGTIRKLHGANIGAPIFMNKLRELTSGYLKDLEIPVTRMHDCPWANAGMNLIDIHQIFPLFHADHNDPANYFFKQTDDLVANCLACGSKPYYRLGESIEHTEKNYFTVPPADYNKWAEICVNIIRHYNQGWAEGFNHNIEYWEIWNEPNLGRQMWTGTWDDYVRLYVVASKKIKASFPDAKVGGPGLPSAIRHLIENFLDECRKNGAPLDFLSWHGYGSNVESIVRQPGFIRRSLDAYGFRHAELHLNEWHYTSGEWTLVGPGAAETVGEWNGVNGAAYLCAVLSGWQDSPLDMGHYYTSSTMPWFGLFDSFGLPNKCYYGLKCFTTMTHYAKRFAVDVVERDNVWALGGTNEKGDSAIMLSCCKGHKKRQVAIQIANAALDPAKIKVLCLDADKNIEPTEKFSVSGDTLRLGKSPGAAVFLIELARRSE
jgi:hypothetical protein